jgi:Lon protease-like protein
MGKERAPCVEAAAVVARGQKEVSDAMASIDLPLFPLSQVLVPAMPQPLRIFESRYQEMISACLQGDRRFGVVLIREGHEVGETASPYDVGTVAEITAVAQLAGDEFVILAEGRQRFRIVERFYDRSYLHGTVELLDEPIGLLENAAPLASEVHELAMEYASMVLKVEGEDPVEIALPDEPLDLSYKVLSMLQILDREKQHLLETESAEARLRDELLILRREVLILERMVHMPEQKTSYFNPN